MAKQPLNRNLAALPPRARGRWAIPAYPALLCAVVASSAMTASPSARADDTADAQADVVVDSPAEDGAVGSNADDAADDLQYAGCSAAPYQAGRGQTERVSAAAIAVLVAYGAMRSRRRG